MVSEGVAMCRSSHIANFYASTKVRTSLPDIDCPMRYPRGMARRGVPRGPINWYLREWMQACGIKKQSEMMELTGWSKATMSQLYNGKQDYSPKVVNEAARALKAEPFELLMPPERAFAIRRLREDALRIIENTDPKGFDHDDDDPIDMLLKDGTTGS